MNQLRAALVAHASLVFAASPAAGALVLAAALTRPIVGLAGLIALVAANATARLLGYRADMIASGYYGYSAILVGLALASGHAFEPRLVLLLVLGGIAVCAVTASVGDAVYRGTGLPVLALPFVLLVTVVSPALVHLPLATHDAIDPVLALPPLIDAALRALGAIVFAPTPLAGILVLAAIAIGSRIAAAVAIAGIAVGLGAAALLDTPQLSLAMTYNAALTALAIGAACFVPGRAAFVAGILAAAVAAWVTIGIAATGAPILAWPFTLVGLVVARALYLRSSDRAPFASPLPGATPERNLAYVAGRSRLGLPGPPQLALPFYGSWAVTQGATGTHTHQGPWVGALDFEAVDENGFPFRGDGLRLEDYRCFGLPVLAPVSGIVVAVHEGVADNQPGELDTARPWGNAVVLSFGPELHVVLAHLKLGSVRVAVGQPVVAGQPVAACGASGRSPRPHLHLQVQRTAELGAAAIAFRLVHYVVEGATRTYVPIGLPDEGQRIARPAPSPMVEAFTALPVGDELELALADGGRLRARSEIDLHGDRFLRDLDREDRLYFTTYAGSLVFTSHVGSARSPLRALLQALPRLPSVTGPVAFVDHPPTTSLLAAHEAALHDVARLVGDPVEARAEITIAETDGFVRITTATTVGLRGRRRPRYSSTIEIDRIGLRALELFDRRGATLLRATRKETSA